MNEPDVDVRESAIEGLGVFAARSYEAGERIRRVNVAREVTLAVPLREDLGERVEHCAYPNGKVFLWGFPDRHLNHCCDPNAHEAYESEAVLVVARRLIAAGEEITVDYNVNASGGSSWACRCGVARCLGSTTGDYFLLPEERQREYLPLLARWFVEGHREQEAALRRKAG